MKKLQNNFTTPEQSKWLLELGIPADSADCIYVRFSKKDKFSRKFRENIVSENPYEHLDFYYPCWSVGRLIEIITICREEIYTRLLFSRVDDHTNIENLIHYISAEIENGHIDFSKLED